VIHLGLIRGSRVRQLAQLVRFIAREVPPEAPLVVAGDFNDWGPIVSKPLAQAGLQSGTPQSVPTFPSRLPLLQFDHVYYRGLALRGCHVPRGGIWARMSDHLPLLVEFDTPHAAPA
jgi:endonuclease/exonuclease/phosphatase family metal-dependent hydrolase